jgi:hypothetical protein
MFVEHVLARHTHVCRTVLNVGRHVGCPHDDEAHVVAIGRDDELARGLRVLQRSDAGRVEQRHGLFEDAAFG